MRIVVLLVGAGLGLPVWACGNSDTHAVADGGVERGAGREGSDEADSDARDAARTAEGTDEAASDARDAARTAEGGDDIGAAAVDAAVVRGDSGPPAALDAGPGNAFGKGSPLAPYLVGQNYWYKNAFPSTAPLVQASGVRLVRVGGIEWNNTPPTEAEYVDMVAQIRAIGAEPLLQVSRFASASQAGALVTSLNVTRGLNIRFWSIGNEPEHNQLTPAAVATYVRTIAPAMKAADPSIQIFAPETAWYNDAILGPLIGGANDITGRDASGRFYVDGITFHTYPNPTYQNQFSRGTVVASNGGLRANVRNLRTRLDAADLKNGRTGSAKLQWALTEFNVTWQNPANNGVADYAVTSFLNGQYFAEVFGIAMEFGARFAVPWSIAEDGSRGMYDLGYLDGVGAVKKPRSSYWHMQLVATHFRGRFAAGRTNRPLVRAYGAGDGNKLAVIVLNQEATQGYRFTLHLGDTAPASADPLDIHVDSALSGDITGNIDAQATAVFLFDGKGTLTKRIDYALGDALAWVPPH